MRIEVTTTINDRFKVRQQNITVIAEHERNCSHPYNIEVGCIDEYFSDEDFELLLAMLKKAKYLRTKALK